MMIESDRPWHETVRAQVDPHEYLLKSEISQQEVKAIHTAFWEKIKTESADHPLKEHLFYYGDFEMAGVAIVAAYLKAKHGLQNLFVCKSFEAFQAQLQEISQMEGDVRMALILPDEPEDERSPTLPTMAPVLRINSQPSSKREGTPLKSPFWILWEPNLAQGMRMIFKVMQPT